jgi:predicted DNA-binding protein
MYFLVKKMINQISIGFTKEQKEQLDQESNRLGSPISHVVRMAVVEYFQKRGNKAE